jgi:hypothetical protein
MAVNEALERVLMNISICALFSPIWNFWGSLPVGLRARGTAGIMISCLAAGAMLMAASAAAAQSAKQVRRAAPVVPLTNELPAKIIVDPRSGRR